MEAQMTIKRNTNVSGMTAETTSYPKSFTVSFNDIREPGAYYSHDTGWLYRVPSDMLALGHSPLINIVSGQGNYVTKIAEDPWIPVNKARQICSNMDFAVNF